MSESQYIVMAVGFLLNLLALGFVDRRLQKIESKLKRK